MSILRTLIDITITFIIIVKIIRTLVLFIF